MGMDRKDKIEIFFGGVMGIIAIALIAMGIILYIVDKKAKSEKVN